MLKVKTTYVIKQLSVDGLIKEPKEQNYGQETKLFYGEFNSMEEVDEAIIKYGYKFTEYVVLTVKEIKEVKE